MTLLISTPLLTSLSMDTSIAQGNPHLGFESKSLLVSQYLENSSAKATSPVIALVSAPLLQGMVTHANADNIGARFNLMLNPREVVGQSVVVCQAERDPLYTMVNARLWSAPTSDDNIAASFEHMLNPVETSRRSVVACQAERDPLYTMVNARLWSAPTNDGNIAVYPVSPMWIK